MLKFKSCLEATETVSSVVASGLAKTREEAVLALRRIVETGCLAHVANQHHFEDKYLFFQILATQVYSKTCTTMCTCTKFSTVP